MRLVGAEPGGLRDWPPPPHGWRKGKDAQGLQRSADRQQVSGYPECHPLGCIAFIFHYSFKFKMFLEL